MKVTRILAIMLALVSLSLPACEMHAKEEQHHQELNKIVVTVPEGKDVVITQQYVCQIRSKRNTSIRSLESGYLEEIKIKEGQTVKQGEVMFKIMPILYEARLAAEVAEVKVAELEYKNTKRLFEQNIKVVSQQEVYLFEAKLAKAQAKLALAEAELNFATVKAPFDGIVDRLLLMQGSLVKEGDDLTTLSDNSVMWVYFNVPEANYLEYKAEDKGRQVSQLELVDSEVELVLANGSKFPYSPGNTVTIEGQFNNETGNIPFRADFPNPDRLLRHGQTGTVLIQRKMKNAIVIPQRSTFEVLDKRYVFVVDDNHIVQRRLITVQHELEDTYIIKSGLNVNDKIIFEGVREVNDGNKVEYEFRKPEEILPRQKFHAE